MKLHYTKEHVQKMSWAFPRWLCDDCLELHAELDKIRAVAKAVVEAWEYRHCGDDAAAAIKDLRDAAGLASQAIELPGKET